MGKTTIFEALNFITKYSKKDVYISKKHENEDISVEIELDEVEKFEGSLKKYNPYIKDKKLIIKRSSKQSTIKQGEDGKEKTVHLDIKKVGILNPYKNQFENPTGIDRTVSNLIDPQIIYADIHNEDYQDFGSSKITGKLIQEISKNFIESETFKKLKEAHESAFGNNGIKKYLKDTEEKIDNILKKQFGESTMEFEFNFPSVNDLLKKGRILSTEQGTKTDISEKGNGLQRALALAIIQIYSKMENKNDNMQYLIDEPEIYLHPNAQDKLMESLVNLSNDGNQIFITTHSPYILRHYKEPYDSIIIISLDENGVKHINNVNSLMFHPTSIGEVTYKAFGVPTIDFHQMLFTKLYMKWVNKRHSGKTNLAAFDEIFLSKKVKKEDNKIFYPRFAQNDSNDGWKEPIERSIPYIVRTEIDHPETLDDSNKNVWKDEYLKKSIEYLIEMYNKEI